MLRCIADGEGQVRLKVSEVGLNGVKREGTTSEMCVVHLGEPEALMQFEGCAEAAPGGCLTVDT